MKKKIIICLMIVVLIGFYLLIDRFMLRKGYFIEQQEKEILVAGYLKDNISQLSPEKEVLGGKFYITNLIFIDSDSGEVEYEDGHILLKASFDYKIDRSGKIEIYNFKIIKIN